MAKEQKDLPGMEGRGIPELDEACQAYVKLRDKRMDLLRREVEAKADLLVIMKKHKKRDYISDGIEAHIVVKEETVKVVVPKDEEDDEENEKAAGA